MLWRNPRIHDESRVKVWTACPDHDEFLLTYLTSRGFPAALHPVSEPLPDRVPSPEATA